MLSNMINKQLGRTKALNHWMIAPKMVLLQGRYMFFIKLSE